MDSAKGTVHPQSGTRPFSLVFTLRDFEWNKHTLCLLSVSHNQQTCEKLQVSDVIPRALWYLA